MSFSTHRFPDRIFYIFSNAVVGSNLASDQYEVMESNTKK